MKIIYKQPEQYECGSLSRFGVQNCYFKKLNIDRGRSVITKRAHHHTGFELHIVTEGYQEYEVDGKVYGLKRDNFLLIYPNVKHATISEAPHTQKYGITFSKQADSDSTCFFGTLNKRMVENIDYILSEFSYKKEISPILIENSIFEILIAIFRMSGAKENDKTFTKDENMIISLAKKFIDDNIEIAPSVAAVSEYCYLSTKQLTRIFQKFEDVSPGEYIINKRISTIEKLLTDNSLSLKQISEIMNFDNEYYFNSFFKKHAGMPPGEYRKMMGT